MKKRYKLAVLAVLMCMSVLLLCGCESAAFSADSLMRPPAAGGDGARLQKAIETHLGTLITLRYPRRAEHRSAVVRANIDGDEQEEAIVFYRPATENKGARMAVLDMDSAGSWQMVSQGENVGEIDRVLFGDLNGDGAADIVAGWSVFSGASRKITAHTLIGGALRDIHFAPDEGGGDAAAGADMYTEMAIADFDYDGRSEIMSVYLNTVDGRATARMLKWKRDTYSESMLRAEGRASLDGRIAEYIGAQAGLLSHGQYGLVLDGHRGDGTYTTEVVCWDDEEQQLSAPLNDEETFACTCTRAQPITSQDIDADGIINIPTDRLMAGYTADDAAPLYLVTWHRVFNGSLRRETTALMRFDEGYYVEFPERWIANVTAECEVLPATQESPIQDIVYFCRTEDGTELMRIKLFTLDEWEAESSWEPSDILAEDAPRYLELMTTEYYVYAVLLPMQGEEEKDIPVPKYEEVAEMFRLLP
ncbi:MAG: hypothetical protein E7559_00055 [Ruminococcaceae bacterium]|nr:hypothetical protein [Oscillospiraceae bacterium]